MISFTLAYVKRYKLTTLHAKLQQEKQSGFMDHRVLGFSRSKECTNKKILETIDPISIDRKLKPV